MIFPALALCLVAAVAYGEVLTVEQLIKKANEAGAPFVTVALEKMNKTELWGAQRDRRSVDIVIMNTSGKSVQARTPRCSARSLVSPGLEPESNLAAHTSTVLGLQSGKDNEYGWVSCELVYYVSNGDKLNMDLTIRVSPRNARGDLEVSVGTSSNLDVSDTVNIDKNTQVIIVVTDVSGGPVLQLSQKAASLFPQRESKRSRNSFVKASKRGTSVRMI